MIKGRELILSILVKEYIISKSSFSKNDPKPSCLLVLMMLQLSCMGCFMVMVDVCVTERVLCGIVYICVDSPQAANF